MSETAAEAIDNWQDELQAELDELRTRLTLIVALTLATGILIYTAVAIKGRAAA